MEFDPANPIIKLCVQGMIMEEKGSTQEAGKIFFNAWNDATNDFEKFYAAYFMAKFQNDARDQLKWFETALELALKLDNDAVNSALPSLYFNIANCYEALHKTGEAERTRELANSFAVKLPDHGPFYHGTRAELQIGDFLTAGKNSNYKADIIMNHIYFTSIVNGAGLAAALAKGEGRERVYIVEPTGSFENDPNVTDKKFPGNPTRSFRTSAPLKIVGEVAEWSKISPENLRQWREKLANSKGDIIN